MLSEANMDLGLLKLPLHGSKKQPILPLTNACTWTAKPLRVLAADDARRLRFEMKSLLIFIGLTLANFVWAFDHDVVKGQWAVYKSSLLSKESYYFLHISDDFSGTFIRALGHEPITRKFTAQNVKKQNSYIEIELSPNETAVLSAWKLKSGSGRLTGQILMSKENGELFNMLNFPLDLVTPNHKLLSHKTIKVLCEKHR